MNLSESIVVLTGATDGIGLATARLLVPRVRHPAVAGLRGAESRRGDSNSRPLHYEPLKVVES